MSLSENGQKDVKDTCLCQKSSQVITLVFRYILPVAVGFLYLLMFFSILN